MANVILNQHYVNFLRGTPAAWAKLQDKDPDTLYFISEKDGVVGKLYLGEKLISDSTNINALESLIGISEDTLAPGQILVYDEESEKWKNKDVADVLSPILSVISGATAESGGTAGLVPASQPGDENKFLKADGTWATYMLTEENIESVLNRVESGLYWDNF